jgi:hypothetical protein
MTKILLLLAASFVFSLIFHFILGGDSNINYQQMVIHVNLYAIIIAALLCTNLLVLILLLRNKKG